MTPLDPNEQVRVLHVVVIALLVLAVGAALGLVLYLAGLL